MIRPAAFGSNVQTASTNAFQKKSGIDPADHQAKALEEFDAMVARMRSAKLECIVAEDTLLPTKPDAIFPNNWFSLHPDGSLILYPMMAPNRRYERRTELFDSLNMRPKRIIDLSHYEEQGRFLEGTGSIVFDHQQRIAYAVISPRTDAQILKELCRDLNYRPHLFHAIDSQGQAIYHTNVMLSIASHFIIYCDEVIAPEDRESLRLSLLQSGRRLLPISMVQMEKFCANVIEIKTIAGEKCLLLSKTAWEGFTVGQKSVMEESCALVPVRIPHIESIGGGGARCMVAEVF